MQCQQCKNNFEITDQDRKFYHKIEVPVPDFCPDCRFLRRLVWRNELNLYKNKCQLCGIELVSNISSDKPYKVYCRECYWSDKWDATEYGRDFDFKKTFNEQFDQLIIDTPIVHLLGFADNINSVYANYAASLKNCYMYCAGGWAEDVYYGFYGMRNKDCMDVAVVYDNELSYELLDCQNCYNVKYAQDCKNCVDSGFLYDCHNCTECFCSTSLRNRSYVFLNEQLSKDDYKSKINKINLGSYKETKKWFDSFEAVKLKAIRKYANNNKSVNCEGDYIENSLNCLNSHTVIESENIKYCDYSLTMKDGFDCTQMGVQGERLYDLITGGIHCFNDAFGVVIRDCTNTFYSYVCHNCSDCFGCANLRQKKFCVLNKQYSEKEYYTLREKIVKHMEKTGEYGNFFSPNISPFCYNETVAQEYFPISKEQAFKKGYKWQDALPGTFNQETIAPDEMPDDIKDVDDSIAKEILVCEVCKRNFKIILQEYDFYKKQNIPLPRKCFSCRHLKRLNLRNPRQLWDRGCFKCQKKIRTTYAPDRKELVYCEECYQKEIY